MNLKRIIREELDDFDWVRNLEPIPEEIMVVPSLPRGKYKVWFGEIPKEQQIAIIEYLIDIGENSESMWVGNTANQILFGLKKDRYDITSLYIQIVEPSDILSPIKKKIYVTMMAIYPEGSEDADGLTREEQLHYCRDWYDNEAKYTQEIRPNLNESENDEWEWVRTTQPVELQNPEDWIGRSFGYGQPLIDGMTDDEIEYGDDEEYYTILGIDDHGNLPLVKHHPTYGENYDSSTSPKILRDYISSGLWVWK